MKIFRICCVLSFLFVSACSTITPIHPTVTSTYNTSISLATKTPYIPLVKDVYNCSQIASEIARLTEPFMPDHLRNKDSKRDESDFDINRYFDILQHISMETGYVLDYVLNGRDSLAGEPLVYAHPLSQKPYQTVNEFLKAKGGQLDDYTYTFVQDPWTGNGSTPEYFDHIVIEDTSQGYFEYAVFLRTSAQFYVYGIAAVYKGHIVCDDITREKFITPGWTESQHCNPMPDDVGKKARAADLEPIIKVESDKIDVQFVMFGLFSGFYQTQFSFNRSFPHKLLHYDMDIFAPYNCGVTI